jgi:GNAT superfamily N-acetyltransferase
LWGYRLAVTFFTKHIYLAESVGRPVGFITTIPLFFRLCLGLFVWQVGVLAEYRGRGISQALIRAALSRHRGLKRFVVGIDPKNEQSMKAFRAIATEHGAILKEWRRPRLVSVMAIVLKYFRERVLYVRFCSAASKPRESF